jgi:hypothetical protein
MSALILGLDWRIIGCVLCVCYMLIAGYVACEVACAVDGPDQGGN